MIIVLSVGSVPINAHMVFTKKTAQNLLSFIQRDVLIAVQGVRLYVQQKRSSILEIQVALRPHAAAGVVDSIG